MTTSTRSGLIGQALAHIEELQAQLRTVDHDTDSAMAALGDAVRNPLHGAGLAGTVRQRYVGATADLQRQLDHAMERRKELLAERTDVQKEIAAVRQYIETNEPLCRSRYLPALALLDQVTALLDRNNVADYEAIDEMRDVRGPLQKLPDRVAQHRARLAVAEQRLLELGSE